MSKNSINEIEHIQHGRLDIYIPLKFETNYSFNNLCNRISKYIDEEIGKHISQMNTSLQDIYENLQDEMHIKENKKLSVNRRVKKNFRDKRISKERKISRENDGTKIELIPTHNGIKLTMMPGEMNAYYERCHELEIEYERQEKIYGNKFVNSQKRFVLFPVHAQLNSGEFVWINIILYIFANKIGILKFELPLSNVSSQPLKEYNYDEFIEKVDDKWEIIDEIKNITSKDIYSAHLKRISEHCRVTIVSLEYGILKNIILSSFDGIPKNVDNIPIEIKKELFRIIAAPVSNTDSMSYTHVARDYIEKYSWGQRNIKYITSNNGGCLSIVDTTLIDCIKQDYIKQLGVEVLEANQLEIIYKNLIRDVCINVEFVLLVLLLKRINSTYMYGMKLMNPKEIHKIQREYNLNLMFISGLQEQCYGTVSEQLDVFEKLMPYYINNKIAELKMDAIDRILYDEESQRYDWLQNFLAIGGLLATIIFGLPAIYDTVLIIRNECSFITEDIPVLTLENVSIGLWIILMLIFGIYTLVKWNSNKGKRHLSLN